jgi:FKBP-type peptidyl-prolyl cis-trans isomerase 2
LDFQEKNKLKKTILLVSIIALSLWIIPLTGCGDKVVEEEGTEEIVDDGKVVEDGDYIKVHYTGTLDDGSVFDSSEGREPLAFTAGAGQMIAGFDAAVMGMKVGEVKTVTIPAEDAYGSYDEELLLVFTKDELPEGIDPKVGDQIPLSGPSGRVVNAPVIEVTDTTVTVDANHRLAGKDLTFEIELVELTRGE